MRDKQTSKDVCGEATRSVDPSSICLFIYFMYLIAFTMITILKKTREGKIHLNKTQKRAAKVRDT